MIDVLDKWTGVRGLKILLWGNHLCIKKKQSRWVEPYYNKNTSSNQDLLTIQSRPWRTLCICWNDVKKGKWFHLTFKWDLSLVCLSGRTLKCSMQNLTRDDLACRKGSQCTKGNKRLNIVKPSFLSLSLWGNLGRTLKLMVSLELQVGPRSKELLSFQRTSEKPIIMKRTTLKTSNKPRENSNESSLSLYENPRAEDFLFR